MKRILTITVITIASLALLYGAFVVYIKLHNSSSLFIDYRYNKVIIEPLAKLGCTDAQYKMGIFNTVMIALPPSEEYDVKADLEKAIYWFEKASAKGHEKATTELANAKKLLNELNNP